MVWSYLPILQYDATRFGSEDKRKKIAWLISFDFRLILSFRTMGVFYPLEIDVINRTFFKRQIFLCIFQKSHFSVRKEKPKLPNLTLPYKIGQGQPRVTMYINFVELESLILQAKF